MEIKPIKTERDYQEAMEQLSALWGAKDGSPEADRLDVLVTLVEAYEDKTTPMGKTDPIAAIEFHMEQNDFDRKDLGKVLRAPSGRVSEIMNGKRKLTVEMIRALHDKWGIPFESLLASPKKRRRASLRRAAAEAR